MEIALLWINLKIIKPFYRFKNISIKRFSDGESIQPFSKRTRINTFADWK